MLPPATTYLNYRQTLLAALLSVTSLQVMADSQDSLVLVAGAQLTFDSNLYRLPADSTSSALTAGRSERISTANFGVRYKTKYSLQTLQLEASVTGGHFQNYSSLNYTATNYAANWGWAVTPNMTGTLYATRSQNLSDFASITVQSRNIVTTQTQGVNANYNLGNALILTSNLSHSTSLNSNAVTTQDSNSIHDASVGIKYALSTGSSFELGARRGNGKYNGQLAAVYQALGYDNQFKENETYGKVSWSVSPLSSLNLKVSRLARIHANVPERNYTAVLGNLGYTWQPAAKLAITASLSSDVGAYQDTNYSYSRGKTFAIAPSWAITAKSKVGMRYEKSQRTFQTDGYTSFMTAAAARIDKYNTFALTYSWTITDALSLTAQWQRQVRNSTLDTFDYSDNSLSVGIQGQF